MKQRADYILDFRGTIKPIILLKASRLFREMSANETLEIRGCHFTAREDLLKVLPASCYKLIGMKQMAEGEDTFRIQLMKIKEP